MEDKTTVNGQTLVLNGAGLRKKFFIKVYVGGLYLPAKMSNPASILGLGHAAPHGDALPLQRQQRPDVRSVGGRPRSEHAECIRRGEGAFKTLCSWMEPIPKGNRLVITYVPGTGTIVEVNGKVKGTMPGKATADAIVVDMDRPETGHGRRLQERGAREVTVARLASVSRPLASRRLARRVSLADWS